MTGWLTVEVGERRVEAVVAGAAAGVALVFHHGTPAAATELRQLLDPALACGLPRHLPVAARVRRVDATARARASRTSSTTSSRCSTSSGSSAS